LNIHGESGLDGADLPQPTTPLDGTDAVGFIIDACRALEGLWLVPTGPLTNIGLAIRNAPDIVGRVRGVSLMGGGSFGNRSAMAEFNIWADPHAAHIVFGSGVPLTMAGLDVTHQFLATQSRISTIRAIGGQLATVLSDLLTFFSATYADLHDAGSWPGGAVHDPLAVLAVTHPDLFESVARHVDIETTGELTRGMTVIDERTIRSRQAANCNVLTNVDADRGFRLIADAISRFSK
jgi:inosine-uridine nucleoside N-ribohydrolase